MVQFGYRRRLSLQACPQVEALRAGTRHLLAKAVEIQTATATFLVAMMDCQVAATVLFGMGHGLLRTNGRQISSEWRPPRVRDSWQQPTVARRRKARKEVG